MTSPGLIPAFAGPFCETSATKAPDVSLGQSYLQSHLSPFGFSPSQPLLVRPKSLNWAMTGLASREATANPIPTDPPL